MHKRKSGGRQPAVGVRMQRETARSQERRASARRGCVIQAIRGRYGTLFGDYRTHEQDRHTSPRRAYEYRTCNRERFRRMSSVAPSAILKPANLPAVSDRE
jgi:ribosomal protein L20